MKKLCILALIFMVACKYDTKKGDTQEKTSRLYPFHEVESEIILENDSLSIRAIEVIGENLAFAANHGIYGLYNATNNTWKTNIQNFDTLMPEFRAVASTPNDFFMLSIGNPALLYKTGDSGKMELVYKEEHKKVFYDALAFWNEKEGIAIGDPTNDCISIIITRNGGDSWTKIDCGDLPKAVDGEAAFAASNSNIAIQGENTWIITGGTKSRILYSPDKGKNWEIFNTPLVQGQATTGGYSMDFYDAKNGIIIGGDYTSPENNSANKAVTKDGGRSWKLIAEGKAPGYKSSVRYVPNSGGREIVATGFTGIHYSSNGGETWTKLSNEGFFTLRFLNDSLAYAAGKGRIAKLHFR